MSREWEEYQRMLKAEPDGEKAWAEYQQMLESDRMGQSMLSTDAADRARQFTGTPTQPAQTTGVDILSEMTPQPYEGKGLYGHAKTAGLLPQGTTEGILDLLDLTERERGAPIRNTLRDLLGLPIQMTAGMLESPAAAPEDAAAPVVPPPPPPAALEACAACGAD